MIKLSIIIPFYNVEQYFAQCLDSVYQQDIPEEEYEVICVNDASPDDSRAIVKEYQKKHKNLILVEHEVNKKLGAARNTGRRVAQGKYIWNVDSDDMIVPNCLKTILEQCEQNYLDVLIFDNYSLQRDELVENKIHWDADVKPCSGLEFWQQQGISKQSKISQVWTQVYKRSFMDEYQIYSPEINMSEDVPYAYASILLGRRVLAIDEPYYVYRDNNASLSRELVSAPTPNTVYENCFVCTKCIDDICKRIPKSEQKVLESVHMIERYMVLSLWRYVAKMSARDEKELKEKIRKNIWQNRFVLKVLNHKQRITYIKWLFKH